ncbi:MAG: hypothetical protein M3441_23165 [Chloroflexota bacterium]|nr:hypothetical protein [Chloroflexota bacterium]
MTTRSFTAANESVRFPKVTLIEPAPSGYIHIAAEVDRRPPFLPNSRKKRELIAKCKRLCRQLEADPSVVSAVVFDALLIPPGRGEFIKERPGRVHVARFDLAVLIETTSPETADAVKASPAYAEMERALRETATFTHVITATNVKRIGPVDHSRQGVFLFNYFFADDTAQNLAVWEYTAGWFQQETGLDNSTVLLPRDGERSNYNIINHCRWDRLRDVLPSLIFKRTFCTYVLVNFEANRVAAMPILYRMA